MRHLRRRVHGHGRRQAQACRCVRRRMQARASTASRPAPCRGEARPVSVKVMSLIFDRFPFGGSRFICILAMADWCDDKGGNLYPSIPALAAKMRVSRSQAQRVLHELLPEDNAAEALGLWWIKVVGNEQGGAPGSTRRTRSMWSGCETSRRSSSAARRRVALVRRVAWVRRVAFTHKTGRIHAQRRVAWVRP